MKKSIKMVAIRIEPTFMNDQKEAMEADDIVYGNTYPSSVVKKYWVGILHEFTQSPVHPLVSR